MSANQSWDTIELKVRYASDFDVDISEFIQSSEVTLHRDEENGILLFEGCKPGSGEFYEALAKKPYYYIEDKWEFDQAIECFPTGDTNSPKDISILEIGSGAGSFLERCRDRGYANAQGIEFNARALEICREKQLNIADAQIEDIAATGKRFDVVCAYQVLEHVPEPAELVRLASSLLKENGKLIFSTPNAASFLSRFRWNLLDLPPHHMSRWDAESYSKTSESLGLELEELRYEPLAKYHHKFFAVSMAQWLPERSLRQRILKPLLRLGFKMYPFKKSIPGHSIMAVISHRREQFQTGSHHAVA